MPECLNSARLKNALVFAAGVVLGSEGYFLGIGGSVCALFLAAKRHCPAVVKELHQKIYLCFAFSKQHFQTMYC